MASLFDQPAVARVHAAYRLHLRPGGIAAFNSTFSGDVLETARAVFPFVERRTNFIYGSAVDFSGVVDTAEQAIVTLT